MNIYALSNCNKIIGQINKSQQKATESIERLTSGHKLLIDNPVDAIEIDRLTSNISSSDVAQSNIQNGMSYLQTESSALNNIGDMANRLKEISTQYNDGSISYDTKANLKKEASLIMKNIGNVYENTAYNGKAVFSQSALSVQAGPNVSDKVTLELPLSTADIETNQELISATTGTIKQQNTSNVINQKDEDSTSEIISTVANVAASKNNTNTGQNSTATSSPVSKYMLSTPQVNIPDQNGYTGFKKITDNSGNLIYDGSLINGKLNGWGTYYCNGKIAYQGNWNDNNYDGYGTVYNSNGSIKYQGTTKQGVPDGWGTYSDDNGKMMYQGYLKNGMREGWGTTYNTDGSSTSGFVYDYSTYSKSTGTNTTPTTPTNGAGGNTTDNTDFSLKNIGTYDVDKVLSTGFVDKNIIDPIASAKSMIGSDEEILKYRSDYLESQQDAQSEELSNLQDIDMAKEAENYIKQSMLSEVATTMLAQTTNMSQKYVSSLLSSLS